VMRSCEYSKTTSLKDINTGGWHQIL
jgi:hypothetical protein